MATASIEIGSVDLRSQGGSSINGRCQYQESLAISGSTATMTNAVTAAQAAAGALVARVVVDLDCYFAVGTTPDPTVTAMTAVTSARRLVPAGSWLEAMIGVGEKIAVQAKP